MSNQSYSFLNRDLSWLSFNERVLMEAADPAVPSYSRFQFLSIFSSNLDEFFRVRMPSIKAFTEIKAKKTSLREEYPEDLVERVRAMVHHQQQTFGNILVRQLLPALNEQGIHLYYGEHIEPIHRDTIREYFLSRVLSFLQPILLQDEKKQGVFLENNFLYFIAQIEPLNAAGTTQYALLNIPSDQMTRLLELEKHNGHHYLIFLDDVIRENLAEIFPGYKVIDAFCIKLTRDAALNVEDEFTGDLAEKIEKQLDKRDIGPATRLLHDAKMPSSMQNFLSEYLNLAGGEMVAGGRYHNLKDLGSLPNPTQKRLTYTPWPVIPHPDFSLHHSIFSIIERRDVLLHLPYHSYNNILRFFNEAAIDPHVKEIYVTLYRVAAQSHIVNALISAARNGKKVTVFVELKARFDEANNIKWSKKMKAAGVRIINSIPGLKVHAKTALVQREDAGGVRSYSLLATGNFNEATGRFYTDHVLFTSKKEYGKDLLQLFNYLQARMDPEEYGRITFEHLLVSQFNMVKQFNKLIEREMDNSRAGLPAGIIIKLNNLQERSMIEKLYEASRAGVKIELIVRSICCLAPGLEGQSENITIRRIVDRYLEHARIFVFHNNGQPEYFMGSADWMTRNLFNRIEVVFPVKEEGLKNQLKSILGFQLNDSRKGVIVKADLTNESSHSGGEDQLGSQESIYNYIKNIK